jgi:hypothetical protein
MKKFNIFWTETTDYCGVIEANNEEEVKDKFFEGSYDYDNAEIISGHLEDDSLVIEEVIETSKGDLE